MSTIHMVRVIQADRSPEALVLMLVTREGENFSYTISWVNEEQISDMVNLLIFGFGFKLEEKPHVDSRGYVVAIDTDAMIGREFLAKFEGGKWTLGYFTPISEDRTSEVVNYRERLKRKLRKRRKQH
jgi:hypothetical protein